MSSITKPTVIRSRVPNGVAQQRLRVALTVPLLETIKADADKNQRTVSSMAALIIADYYTPGDRRAS